MKYLGREIRVLIIFPSVREAISKYLSQTRHVKLINTSTDELEFGLDEVNSLVELMGAKLLSGKKATIHGLLETLQSGYDIVWLITHANEDGWFLSDGIVSASETTALIRSCGAFLTVMNTCSSYDVARKAAKEIGSAFICTLKEVPDRTAFITGVLFAQKLVAGYDYKSAYELAKPGQNSTYELIEASKVMTPASNPRTNEGSFNDVDRETILRFIESVKDIDIMLNGSPRLGAPGIKTTISNLEAKVDKLSTLEHKVNQIASDVAAMKSSSQIRSILLWAFGITTFVLAISVIVLTIALNTR